MRKFLLVSLLFSVGCVFQENPVISGNPEDDNATNNLLNNSTSNNTTNNASNNVTNNTNNTNNTTNNATNNQTTTTECFPQPTFCEGYFNCGTGTYDLPNDFTCEYNCGTCLGDSRCLPSVDICTSKSPILTDPMSQYAVEFDDSRDGMAVLWGNNSFGILRLDGSYVQLKYGVAPVVTNTAISASPTKWVALGRGSASSVVIGVNGSSETDYQEILGSMGSGFGTDVALSDVERIGGDIDRESGFGVVGAPGDANAFIIQKTAATDWKIIDEGSGLRALLQTNPLAFGERVAISPGGKTILVRSSDGIEVFRWDSTSNAWAFDQRLTFDGQEAFGERFAISDDFAVVASERRLNFYPVQPGNSLGENVKTVILSSDPSMRDVKIISAGNNKTVVFALIEQDDVSSVQLWQPPQDTQQPQGDWILTNTIVQSDLGFDQFLAVGAGVIKDPSSPLPVPVLVLNGLEQQTLLKTQLLPLVPTRAEP